MIDNKFCVLIVDDEVRMTRALKDFYKSKKYSVLIANNGEEALDVYYANNEKIDVILLDVMMPIMDGMEVLQELRENGDDVPVIMLTAKSQEEDELEGFNNGAYDYVTKPFLPSVLFARTENVLKRANKFIDESITIGDLNINIPNHTVIACGKNIDLTKREFDLLNYLVLNKNIVLSREKILNAVWGYEFDGDIRTVDTHIKQLRLKLVDIAYMIRTVHRVGYIFEFK